MLLAAQVRLHGKVGVLEFEVDREREFLRHVVRLELERALCLSERPLKVAERRQHETDVVVRLGKPGLRLDGASERVARVLEATQLSENQADAVPRDGILGLGGQDLAIRFERKRQMAALLQEQREIESRLRERRACREGRAKGRHGALRLAGVEQCDREIIVRERVRGVCGECLAVAVRGLGKASLLMQGDAALVPQLRAVGPVRDEPVIQRDGGPRILSEQPDLRQRLQGERGILAPLERKTVFPLGFRVITLLTECDSQIVMGELPPFGHLHVTLGAPVAAPRRQVLVLLLAVLIDGKIGPHARERGVQAHRPPVRLARLIVTAHVAEDEAEQKMRIGIVGVEVDGPAHRGERFLVPPLIVEHFAEVEVRDRALRIEPQCLLEPDQRVDEVAARLLGEAELHNRAEVAGSVMQ